MFLLASAFVPLQALDWELDVFAVADATHGNPLLVVCMTMMEEHRLLVRSLPC
jgi:hypothetical protein